ncbi:hypothetical protein ACTVCO_04945 [Sanguibacter sp. A247]|uniref:hypothetical protein n=1 Tax=unclassified Sanguibacter TaxID=2645534 RepID=UPI003FD7147D
MQTNGARVVAFLAGAMLLWFAYREAVRPWGSDPVTAVAWLVGASIFLSFALRPRRKPGAD